MAVAVICEFNPFHNGHKYLLSEARRLSGGGVLAVMSGSFTQRGEPAITDKFSRAAVALRHGADLVAELPAAYAVASARRFALGGVNAARSFSCVDCLAFGCETDDLGLLTAAAQAYENAEVNRLVALKMRDGDYYPRALEAAVRSILGDGAADVLKSPNNVLAVEYIRALRDSGIRPLPVKRVGAAHDSGEVCAGFASASLIRARLRSGEDVTGLLPEAPGDITRPENLERALLCRLRTLTREELAALPEVNEGLENRIYEAVRKYNSVEEILSAVKSKRYTHARLRRTLICALLDITEELQSRGASYVRVLGFNTEGEKMLRSCAAEIVTSPAKALKDGGDNAEFLRADIRACDLLGVCFDRVKPASLDFCTKIIREN